MATADDLQVTAPVARVLDGHQAAADTDAQCFHCHDRLTEGDPCRVYAYRLSDEGAFSVAELACRGCRPDRLHGTLGAVDVLADAWLAIQSMPAAREHRLVLTNTAVVATSPPGEGAGA